MLHGTYIMFIQFNQRRMAEWHKSVRVLMGQVVVKLHRKCKVRMSSRRGRFLVLILGVCLYLVYLLFKTRIRSLEVVPDNIYSAVSKLSEGKLLVDTNKCKIPDIPLWSEAIPLIEPDVCNEMPNLTYVVNKTVVINLDVLQKLGYQFDEVDCCYRTIHRVEQSEEFFDGNADNKYRKSEKCYPMALTTEVISDFISVYCTKTYLFFFRKTFFEGFHMIAQFPKDDYLVMHKLSYWDSLKNQERPPNVLLIGIDSTSRLNFHRFLKRTTEVLTKEIGAVEMTGYTKVGENTFPNAVALVSPYSREELEPICFQSNETPQDNCPYIWKNFSNLHYLTAHLEDSPDYTIFNYRKTGFIRKPADIYYRPLMLAVNERFYDPGMKRCVGHQATEEIILKYIEGFFQLSVSRGIPFFLTSWLSCISHEVPSHVGGIDNLLANLLHKFHSNGLLTNTILFVMSDHGYRFGAYRSTGTGWFEEKLPALFIKLPSKLVRKHPSWLRGLKYNSRQLLSPHDLHATFKDILVHAKTVMETSVNEIHKPLEDSPKTFLERPPVRGLSIFQKLPTRTCEEAGVPQQYCACDNLLDSSTKSTRATDGAKYIVEQINGRLSPACEPLKLGVVTGFAKVSESSQLDLEGTTETDYIISLVTSPGGFSFEAFVTFDNRKSRFTRVASEIQRTNRKTRTTDCLNSSNFADLELYCYCNWPFGRT